MAGIPTVLVTDSASDESLWSNSVTYGLVAPGISSTDPSEIVAALEATARQLHSDETGDRLPLFYGNDRTLKVLLDNQQRLSRWFAFVLEDPDLGRSLLDKAQFARLCASQGVLAPRTAVDLSDPTTALSGMRAPFIVKPQQKVDWKELKHGLLAGGKARVFDSLEAILAEPSFWPLRMKVMVQEYVPGGTDALLSYHGFIEPGGRLVAEFGGRKIRTSPPIEGESSFVTLDASNALLVAGREVARKLGLHGVFKIDLKLDRRTGEFVVLEVNSRFNLWHYLAAVDGVNLPAIVYRYLTTGTLPAAAPSFSPQHRWVNLYGEIRGYRSERRAGTLTFGKWLGSLLGGRNIYEQFDWTDPVPATMWLAHHVYGWFSP